MTTEYNAKTGRARELDLRQDSINNRYQIDLLRALSNLGGHSGLNSSDGAWIGHTAMPQQPGFQPRFQGMFSGMLSDPWHQFMNQKEYENRRDRAIANQMDELYRRNQLDQLAMSKMLQAGSLANRAEGDQQQQGAPQGNLEDLYRTTIGSFIQNNPDGFTYEQLNQVLRDIARKNPELVDKFTGYDADLKNKLFENPLDAAFKVSADSFNKSLENFKGATPGSQYRDFLRTMQPPTDDEAANAKYNGFMNYFGNFYDDIIKGNDIYIRGTKINNKILETFANKFFGYQSGDLTPEQKAAAAAAYASIEDGRIRAIQNAENFYGDDSADAISAAISTQNPDFWESSAIKGYRALFNEFGNTLTSIPSLSQQEFKDAINLYSKHKNTYSVAKTLYDNGLIDAKTLNSIANNTINKYDKGFLTNDKLIELLGSDNNISSIYTGRGLIPGFNAKVAYNESYYDGVLQHMDTATKDKNSVFYNPNLKKLILSDKIEDQNKAKRILMSMYYPQARNSQLGTEQLELRPLIANNLLMEARKKLTTSMDIENAGNFDTPRQNLINNYKLDEDYVDLIKAAEGTYFNKPIPVYDINGNAKPNKWKMGFSVHLDQEGNAIVNKAKAEGRELTKEELGKLNDLTSKRMKNIYQATTDAIGFNSSTYGLTGKEAKVFDAISASIHYRGDAGVAKKKNFNFKEQLDATIKEHPEYSKSKALLATYQRYANLLSDKQRAVVYGRIKNLVSAINNKYKK